MRTYLWPRRSFSRSLQYFSKRILRLKATPHAVAAGVAAGVFASFFPLGFHFAVAAVLCWVIAGNLVAAALGAVFFGNPLTFPLLWGASWEVGKLILHEHLPKNGPPAHLGEMMHTLSFAKLWHPILEPMLIGAVFFGNPLTFPLLWGASWETGKLILHERLPKNGPPAHLGEMLHTLSFAKLWHPILEPMLIGAVPLGLIFGLIFYGITRWGMTAFREQRRKRIAERAQKAGHGGREVPAE